MLGTTTQINIFTAFGYLESGGRPGRAPPGAGGPPVRGLFLQEMIHREALVRRFLPYNITRHDDGMIVLEERRFDLLTSRMQVRVTLLPPDGQGQEYEHTERIYSLTELARLLAVVELQIEAHYGGLDGSPLTLDSRRLAVLSRKGAQASTV